ncbi:hypothetical protein KG892_01410 [Vermiphilus pyriformis]|jgi:hypothetical protein|uniref:Uncharacterized protein n=1 Tax=candidate division TM6 bacterium JCVI TM6SC1 TaxID=1306947 RepID=A0A0D2GQK7_9BACT|nr:hypothetical protein J120_01735 [candidate division TM6 bacterium JCVI TM6SC1]UNE35663.1 MAG: hypothetical protein KG892_01410 [Vermiphilus pyriformis]
MNNHEWEDIDSDQFVISYELLALLKWIVEHDTDRMKKMIARALSNGLDSRLQRAKAEQELSSTNDEIHSIMIDFLVLLETCLAQAMNEQLVKKVVEHNLMPTIDHIDTQACDSATVRASVVSATNKNSTDNSVQHRQDTLYKELLKRWKPDKNYQIN